MNNYQCVKKIDARRAGNGCTNEPFKFSVLLLGKVNMPGCKSLRIRCFTLFELLCTIAVIVILVALLLPTLNVAKKRVREINCLNNQKQLGMAFLEYVNDFDCMPQTNPNRSGGGTVGDGWYAGGVLSPYLGLGNIGLHIGFTKKGALIAQCPEETDVTTKSTKISYGMNQWLTGGYRVSAFQKISICKTPAQTCVFMDNVTYFADCYHPDNFAFRHRNGAVIYYLDGHCSWKHMRDISTSPTDPFW